MKYKIAVLMGGSSFERDFSLASGKNVINALEAEGHEVLALDTSASLVEVLRTEKPDVALIALHGGYGEDGTVQSLLEYLAIPFVGSPSAVCRETYNKSMLPHVVTKVRLCKAGKDGATGVASKDGAVGVVSWPKSVCLSAVGFKKMGAATALDLISQRIGSPYPYAVLPASGGSALGINKVENQDELANALLDALSYDDEVLVEEWVDGVEIAVSVIGSGESARVLPPVEICPKTAFFKTEARLEPNLVNYYCPVRLPSLSEDEKRATQVRELIEQAALEVHRSFDCRDLSRIDMFWTGKEVKVLEINVCPGMAELSLLPMACKAAHLSFGELLNELLDVAVKRG